MKKWLLVFVALVGVGLVVFFSMGPVWLERSMNQMISIGHVTPSERAEVLHQRLVIADMHADTLLWRRSVLESSDRGHVDLPRLQAGNVALQVFSTVTKSPAGLNYDSNNDDSDTIGALAFMQLQPARTWDSLLQRSLWHAEKLHAAAENSDDLMIVRGSRDLQTVIQERHAGRPLVGALLSVEGLHNLEADAANLIVLFEAGYRMAGLTHFFDNALAGSMHGVDKGGLTDFGREIVREMESLGMIVDIAHLSAAGVDDVLAMATRPVVVSHGGVKALCDANRNLSDEQIRGVAATGGVVGIGYWDAAVCDTRPAAVAAAIVHVISLVGVDHVGLGSDYDGAVAVSFDTSELSLITQALMDEGLSDEEIVKVMGVNVLRLLALTLPF